VQGVAGSSIGGVDKCRTSYMKRSANREERKLAKRLDGKRTPLSGAIFGSDVTVGDWNIEVKTTGRASYRLLAVDVERGVKRAFSEGKRFAMFVRIGKREVWVLPESEFAPTNGPDK